MSDTTVRIYEADSIDDETRIEFVDLRSDRDRIRVERLNTDPWRVWFDSDSRADYTPQQAREFALALLEAADEAEFRNSLIGA